MQQHSQQTFDALTKSVTIDIQPVVIAEWELNAFFEPEITGPESNDDDLFPLDSIILPRRPEPGVPKFIFGQSKFTEISNSTRYRYISPSTKIKYFHSKDISDSSGDIDNQTFTLEYDQRVPCNKLVIAFENSFSGPENVDVEVMRDAWSSLGTFDVNDGIAEIYFNKSWGEVQPEKGRDREIDNIKGFRFTVSNITAPSNGLTVIQFSPRLEFDFTSRLFNGESNTIREEITLASPVGIQQASRATIDMINDDGLLSFENEDSVLYGLLDENVKFRVYDIVNGQEEFFNGSFYSELWSVNDQGRASVEAVDKSKFLQEATTENCWYKDRRVGDIVRDVMYRFGHKHVDIRIAEADDTPVPYVFFNDQQSIWTNLIELAKAEQATFYFDENEVFVWESRDYPWQDDTVDFVITDEVYNEQLPNLVTFAPSYESVANDVEVRYTPLEPSQLPDGTLVNAVLWESTGDLVLEASALLENINEDSEVIKIPEQDHPFWKPAGFVNIDGEYMRFEKSDAPGELNIIERGLFNSTKRDHNIDPIDNFWEFYRSVGDSNGSFIRTPGNGTEGQFLVRDSYVQLQSSLNDDPMTTSYFSGGADDDSYAIYGCEMIFPISFNNRGEPFYEGFGYGGLFIHNGGNHTGYRFELVTMQHSLQNEVPLATLRAYRAVESGDGKIFFGDIEEEFEFFYPPQGRPLEIIPGRAYRLEVFCQEDNTFTVFINGVPYLTIKDEEAGTKRTSGHWGVYARNNSIVRFDAVWAINAQSDSFDLSSIISRITDRTTGGFASDTLENAWSNYNQKRADVVYEDFGPIVHEGLSFAIDYEVAPAITADLFISNDSRVHVVEKSFDAFAARFSVVNKSRLPIVLSGSDPLNDNQNMSLLLYGKAMIEGEELREEGEDKFSMRRRGRVEFELNSQWIQTQDRARRIVDWILERWGEPNDIVRVDAIMFPPLQVGDLVGINSVDNFMTPETHKYHVIRINRSRGAEYSFELTLRRARF